MHNLSIESSLLSPEELDEFFLEMFRAIVSQKIRITPKKRDIIVHRFIHGVEHLSIYINWPVVIQAEQRIDVGVKGQNPHNLITKKFHLGSPALSQDIEIDCGFRPNDKAEEAVLNILWNSYADLLRERIREAVRGF